MGYSKRTQPIKGIIIHSTNGAANSLFKNEVTFLYNSPDVAAHYIVGSDEVVELLSPQDWIAYHAGKVKNEKFSNNQSIGIEVHYSPNDTNKIDPKKISNLTELVTWLLRKYNLLPSDIDTHRNQALPKGRKVDPSFWTDLQFDEWRGGLLTQATITNTILNGPQVDQIYLYRALNKYNPGMPQSDKDAIVSAYTTYGELTTIGNLYPFSQAAHETGWFTSRRWIENRNPAGLGATNDGAEGYKATSITDGIIKQYAHLLCYATKENEYLDLEPIAQLSPRKDAMTKAGYRGIAKYWVDLSGKWAVPGSTYGQKILQIGESILHL